MALQPTSTLGGFHPSISVHTGPPGPQPEFQDIEAAARRIEPWVRRTPIVHSLYREAWMKLENLQVTGAFKVRGALNSLLLQRERGDLRKVVAASAGNHGAGVAWAAKQVGLEAVIAVPRDAPRSKVDRIVRQGAEVRFHGRNFDESLVWARAEATRRSWRFVHAFDDPEIIAGQGTIGLEMLNVRPDRVLVPVGGGGMAAGIALALQPFGIPCIGVQVEGLTAMSNALTSGPSRIQPRASIADGLRVAEPGHLTRSICQKYLSGMITVSESAVRHMMVSLAAREGLRVEGAAAVAVVGLQQVPSGRNAVVLSGGNVDESTFRGLLGSENTLHYNQNIR